MDKGRPIFLSSTATNSEEDKAYKAALQEDNLRKRREYAAREVSEAELDEYKTSVLLKIRHDKNKNAVLDKHTVEAFSLLIGEGNTRTCAAKVIGLQRSMLARWLDQGRADIEAGKESVYADLVWTIDNAEGNQERVLVKQLWKIATGPYTDGTLALKILERRNAADWAPALPDIGTELPQFAGLSKQAIGQEARRILQSISTSAVETVAEAVVEPPKITVRNPTADDSDKSGGQK